jgi:uncharacterized protein YgiM (DUF1202 family)
MITAVPWSLTEAAGAQSTKGSYLTTAEVQVRSGPGAKYEVVAKIPKDIKVNVVGREGYWLKIESKHGNKPGYIDEKYARPLEVKQTAQIQKSAPSVAGAYRTLGDIDLREGPGAKYKVVTKLPSGIKIHVVRAEEDWLRVESKRGGKPGYVERFDVERWKER